MRISGIKTATAAYGAASVNTAGYVTIMTGSFQEKSLQSLKPLCKFNETSIEEERIGQGFFTTG